MTTRPRPSVDVVGPEVAPSPRLVDRPGRLRLGGRRARGAALWSVLGTGVGHLYAGAPGRGALVWIASRIAQLPLLAIALVWSGRGGVAAFAIGWVVVQSAAAFDAASVASRTPLTRSRRWLSRFAVCCVAVGFVLVADLAWTMAVSTHLARRFDVRTDAMAPTLVAGDHVLVAAPRHGMHLHPGQLVAYRIWDTPFIKRVAAAPGDTIEMVHGLLRVNGRIIDEPYATHAGEGETTDPRFAWQEHFRVDESGRTGPPTLATWGPLMTPPHEYFLLGDARGQSVDSRYDGFVPDTAVEGRPRVIFFSLDPSTWQVRWDRIGRDVSAPSPR